MQVETGGDALTCAALSSSGEALALGGSGGFIHLWTDQAEPRVNRHSEVLEVKEEGGRGGRGRKKPAFERTISPFVAVVSYNLTLPSPFHF